MGPDLGSEEVAAVVDVGPLHRPDPLLHGGADREPEAVLALRPGALWCYGWMVGWWNGEMV